MTRLFRRLRYLLQRDRHERELDDELRFHLEMKRQELESRGLDHAAAASRRGARWATCRSPATMFVTSGSRRGCRAPCRITGSGCGCS